MRASFTLAVMLFFASIAPVQAQEAAPPVAPAEAAPVAQPPAPTAATPSARKAFTIAVRAALALPMGDFAGLTSSSEVTKMKDEFNNAVPFTIEAGVRLPARFTLGGYFTYGLLKTQETALNGGCSDPTTECVNGRTRRLGAQLLYDLAEGGGFLPWVGAGIGYEWATFDVKDAVSGNGKVTYKGTEFLNLQLGGDFRTSESFYVGPFVMLTFAKYSKLQVEAEGTTLTLDFAEPKVHNWLMFGLRGGFDL